MLEKNSQAIEDAIHDLIKVSFKLSLFVIPPYFHRKIFESLGESKNFQVFVSHEDPADVPADFSIDIRQTIAAAPTAANSNASNLDEEKKESVFEQNCREVIQYFKNRCLEKITFCLKQSLEIIKKRVMSSKNTKDSSIQETFILGYPQRFRIFEPKMAFLESENPSLGRIRESGK